MSKKLNITNFAEIGETLRATRTKEGSSDYILVYDTKDFLKKITVKDKTTGEELDVHKIVILIGKEIDYDTDPKKPCVKLSFLFSDTFGDILDTASYLIPPVQIKEKLVSLLNALNGDDVKHIH